MKLSPLDSYVLAQVLAGVELNGELARVSEAWRGTIAYLAQLELSARSGAFDAIAHAPGFNRDAIVGGLANVNLSEPPPDAPARRSAHLGDLAASSAANRFVWPGWIVRGHFNLLSSDPKIGKTHLMLDWARRLYFELPWPDGQAPSFPAGTTTLWICGDRHQDELRERARAFGLPDEAIRLNALPDDAYGGWDLDEQENVERMRELITSERPGLVYIDTLWRATRRQLRREEEVNTVLDPIVTIAQDTESAIIGAMHLSKDGDTLGRRLEGLARAVMKLSRPDPFGQPDRRKLLVIGNFREPPPLGVTLHDGGCDYDDNPPSEAAPARPGPAPEKSMEAQKFLIDKLTQQNDRKGVELVKEWTDALNKPKATIFDARKALIAAGRLVVDDSRKPQVWHLVEDGSESVVIPFPTNSDPL